MLTKQLANAEARLNDDVDFDAYKERIRRNTVRVSTILNEKKKGKLNHLINGRRKRYRRKRAKNKYAIFIIKVTSIRWLIYIIYPFLKVK